MAQVKYSDKVSKATDEYRKEFIRLVIEQESETEDQLIELQDKIDALVKKNSTSDEIRDEDKIKRALPSLIEAWASGLLTMMVINNIKASEIAGDRNIELVKEQEYGIRDFEQMIKQSVQDYSDWIGKRLPNRKYPTDGITVGSRIKTLKGSVLKTVQNILEVGINNGKSTKEIASAIDNYLVQDKRKVWVSPNQYYREKWGYKVKKVPKGILSGSASSNAIRIARSEINSTWRQATVENHKGHPWLLGYEWRLSPSHPKPDICDDWAAGSPYKERDLPLGHPFCMCDVLPVFYKPEQIDWE